MSYIEAYAPGRAELLGNHTDYNEGLVLSLAISCGTTIRARSNQEGAIRLHSKELQKSWYGTLSNLAPQGEGDSWVNYVLGVIHFLKLKGVSSDGLEMEISSTIPLGAGWSSSASLEIATALVLQKSCDSRIAPMDMARVGQSAEHVFAGVKCGLVDQISVAMSKEGHVTFIDCRTLHVGHLPVNDEVEFVIVHSGIKHALTAGEYNERRESCEEAARLLGVKALRDVDLQSLEASKSSLPERTFKRAMHIVGENERVRRAGEYLRSGDMPGFGKLMFASHESSISNFENSCPELDFLVEAAGGQGECLGARLSGGGFGGATINLVKRKGIEEFCSQLTSAFERRYGKKPLVLRTPACAAAF